MLEKPYRIIGNLWSEVPAVVKVFYGNKYVIVKCKTQSGSLKSIENSLNAYLRGGKLTIENLYYHLFVFVKENPDHQFKVTTIVESSNGFELLKIEQEALDAARLDKNCLNNQVEAYIPEYDYDEKKFGWLNQNAVLNYRKWMRRKKPAKNTKKYST